VFRHWVIAGLLMLLAAAPVVARDDTEATGTHQLDEIHDAYLAEPGLQLERPETGPEPEPAELPAWLEWLGDGLDWFFNTLAPVFRGLFYIVIAIIALAILYFVFGEALNLRLDRFRKRGRDADDSHVTDIRPDAGAARSLLAEADRLAQAGRYSDAVHLLLFRSIADIEERLGGGVPRALTAREITALNGLPDIARDALRPIVGVVETSFFGGREVDRQGWQRARGSYEDFAFGQEWA